MLLLTILLLTLTSSLGSAQDEISLPGWRSDAEYVAQCLNNGEPGTLCDMKAVQEGKVTTLNLGPLSVSGEACLEFWYLSPVMPKIFRLTAYIKDSFGLQKIWSTTAQWRSGSTTWTQVFVPLTNVTLGNEVVFQINRPMFQREETIIKNIGVRKGSCGAQCEAHTQFWPDEATRCLCSEEQLSCSHVPSSGMCTIHSHSDCTTFDGALFRFMAPCSYTLAKTCSATPDLSQFNVEVVSGQSDNSSSMTSVEKVNVNINNFRISFVKRQTERVVVNGVWRTLPLTLASGTVRVSSNQAAVLFNSSFGLFVSFDYTGALHVVLPSRYIDKVCGLCGNFNQNMLDDQSSSDLADSWQTGGNALACETIFVPHHCDPQEEGGYASEAYCGALNSNTGPFAACQEVLETESYFKGCVYGMCASHGDPAVLCDTLQVYADLCKKAGVDVQMSKNYSLCSPQCGENSHYNSCAEGCPEVCSPQDQVSSCNSCEDRCECDPGFKLSGGNCVPAEDCGCWHKGQHYEKGAAFMEGECDLQCVCIGNNNVQCRSSQCSAGEVCSVQNGVKGCFAFSPATCNIYGDPHYVTFDGFAYDFNGGCSYVLTTTCGGQSSVEFTVTGHNMHPPHNNFSSSKLEAVTLEVEDLQITIHQNGQVYENNSQVLLPYLTSGTYGQVRVQEDSGYTVLETTFGLRILMDREHRLFLQVNEHHKYELCGLCGTYSDRQDDDLVMPGGQNATSIFQFGDSWKIQANDQCVSHPNDPKQCTSHELDQAYNQCYALLEEGFSLCHEVIHPEIYITSCVHDYCAEEGNQITLCESLKSYAAACAVAGVNLGQWQDGTICAIQTTVNPQTTSTPLPAPDQTLCPLNCDFETNLCGWEQLVQDSFDWTRHTETTPSSQTGPNYDHTSGEGFYMYIEGNSVTHGDSARMLSSLCQYGQPMCLHFWYHMHGSATAMALNIYMLQGTSVTKLWSKKNNQGPEWKLGQVDITASGPYQIILEGIRGSTDQSDVAIDDISIHFGTCSESIPGLASGTKPPNTTSQLITTQVIPTQVCDLDCNFDKSLCKWNQMVTDAFDWTWFSGSTPTLMTGPPSDHTGGGHYIYIEASSVSYGDTARLISSECSHSGAQCLQFWYHMYGSADTMGLHVYVVEGRNARTVWRQRNNQGNMWHMAQIDLRTTGVFQIIFEGRRGSNDLSDVALDDVSLHYGPCSEINVPSTSTPGTSTAHTSTVHPSAEPTWTTAPTDTTVSCDTEIPTTTPTTLPPPGTEVTTEGPQQTTLEPEIEGTTEGPQQSTPEPETEVTTKGRQTTTPEPEIEGTTERPQPTTPEPEIEGTTERPQPTTLEPEIEGTTEGPQPTTPEPESEVTTDGPQTTTAAEFETTPEQPTSTTVPSAWPTEDKTTEGPQPTVEQPTPSERPQQTTAETTKTAVPSHPPTDTTTETTPTHTTTAPQTTTATTLPPQTPNPTPSCPANSHYSSCVSACAPTCSHLHGPPGCSQSDCVAGCTCDEGYVLYNRVCVPIQKCGCMDDSGKKYDFGDVWYSRHCMEKCKCEKRRGVGKISCEEQEECSRDAVCLQNNNGEYVCEKTDFSDCTINKDPEYRTFDDRKHGFEGEHSYVLVQTNHLPNTLQSIYIEGINGYSEDHEDSSEERRRHDDDDDDSDEDSKEDSDEDSDEDKESVLRALKIRVYNHTVVFKPSRRVVVDGNRVDTPVSPSSGLKIQKRRYRLYLQTDFGLSVEFDGKGKAEIMLPHVYKHKVGGLCGNFDGHRHNDFMKPDGTQTRSVQEFGESWRV
ncbi:unnamed protein product [Knipowitschia caucasica]